MLLTLYNTTDASGNPSSLTSLLPGGVGPAQTTGTTAVPFLAAPRVEAMEREVLDASQTGGLATPAVQGNVLALNPALSANTGGALWTLPTIAAGYDPFASLQEGEFGIVVKAGSTAAIDTNPVGSGVGAMVVIWGPCNALCVAPSAGGAISPGTLLASDGAGNLEPYQPPSAAPTPTVTPTGGSATTWSYALVAIGANGTYSAIGTAGTTTTGAATLTASAYNTITWTPAPDAVGGYYIVRTAAGGTPNTVGTIGQVGYGVATFTDTGLAVQSGTSATQPFVRPATPSTPTVVQVTGATAGTTTWTYKVSAILANGVYSLESTGGSVTTGAAILSASQGNKITWTAVTGATLYAIDRTAAGGTPSTTGFIGYATPAQATAGFIDYGQAATTFTAQLTPNPVTSGAALALSLGSLPSGTTTPTLVPVYVR